MSLPQAKRLAELLCSADRGISDPHFKVCHAALQTTALFVQRHHQTLLPFLERFFPSVLPLLGESKKQIRTEANRVVNEARRWMNGEVVVAALSKVISLTGEKFRIGCTELMMQLVPESGSFFSAPLNMRHVLKVAGKMHSKKRSPLSKSSELLIGALYKYNRQLFASQFKAISEKEQDRLYPLLSAFLPDFSDELKRIAAADRTPSFGSNFSAGGETFAAHKHERLSREAAGEAFAAAVSAKKKPLVGAFAQPKPLETATDAPSSAADDMSLDSRSSTPLPMQVDLDIKADPAPAMESAVREKPECFATPSAISQSENVVEVERTGFLAMGTGRTSMGSGRDEPRQSPTRPPKSAASATPLEKFQSPVALEPFAPAPVPPKSAAKRLIDTPHSALATLGGLGPFASPTLIVQKMGDLSWSPSQMSVSESAVMPPESEVMAAIVRDFSSDDSEVRTSALEVAALWIRRSESDMSAGHPAAAARAIDSLRDPCAHLRERALSVVRELTSSNARTTSRTTSRRCSAGCCCATKKTRAASCTAPPRRWHFSRIDFRPRASCLF